MKQELLMVKPSEKRNRKNQDGATKNSTQNQENQIPWLVALRVLGSAHPHFYEKRGIRFGQLILKYQCGECKITQVDLDSPLPTYRVQVLGSTITVVDKESTKSQDT